MKKFDYPAKGANNTNLQRELDATRHELDIFHKFAVEMIAVQSLDELYWYVAENVVGKLEFADCVVYRLDQQTQTLIQMAAIGEKTPARFEITNRLRIPVGKGITGWVAETKQFVLVNDASKDERFIFDLMEARSELCVPILRGNDVLGVIDCEDLQNNRFTHRDLSTLKSIASLLSVQITQCELVESVKRAQGELLEAKYEAETASSAKTDFLANMSHEIRTPLNGVVGCLSLLADTRLTGKQTRLIGTAQSSADALLALIDDLLDISKIEAGEITLEITDFDPNELVDQTKKMFSVLCNARGIQLVVRKPENLKMARGDEGRIRQVLFNFLTNALKFTEHGQVEVSVTYTANNTLRFEVTDTGIGIDPSRQQVIFGRFRQADSSRRRNHGGVGLGLAICKELVELMGGRIGVSSKLGEGAKFWFETFVEPAQHIILPFETLEENNLSLNGRILVVDDSPTNLLVARAHLEKVGLRVECATNGQEVLQIIQRRPFDAILMDIAMPIMDGYEATRQIRQLPEPLAKIPIIAMTANALQRDREECAAAGMNDFVSKPLRPKILIQKLTDLLSV